MKNFNIKVLFLVVVMSFSFFSCTKDLNRKPAYGLNAATIYDDPANYIHLLAKLYGGLSLTSQIGPAGPTGEGDLVGFDEGYSQYIRELWNLEELSTDESIWIYNDKDIYQLHYMTWNSLNSFVSIAYARILYQVTLCNDFINHTSDANIALHNFSADQVSTIKEYRAEARFLKALSLWHGIDLFGKLPNITDETKFPGGDYPSEISRTDLFNYTESELLSVQNDLVAAHQNEYARADQACAWALLAKLYLNAEVYTGTPRYSDAITYCNKVINAGYTLEPVYRNLFRTDNNNSKEVIFPVTFDGTHSQSYGGTTYLTQACVDNTAPFSVKDSFGVDGGYHRCLHTTSAFVAQFNDANGNVDSADGRYLFFKNGQTLSIDTFQTQPSRGYLLPKFRNISSNGVPGARTDFVDTDFPMFRLGDIYLVYAESVLRGGSGDMGTAIAYVNKLKERAYGNSLHNATSLTLDDLFKERSREMEYEASRRTDLIRFNKFTGGSYLWPWKGNTPAGTSVPDYLKLYPLPNADLVANPNLTQNTGY